MNNEWSIQTMSSLYKHQVVSANSGIYKQVVYTNNWLSILTTSCSYKQELLVYTTSSL